MTDEWPALDAATATRRRRDIDDFTLHRNGFTQPTVQFDEAYLWTPETPCPFTQENPMTDTPTHDSLQPRRGSGDEYAGAAMTGMKDAMSPLPGVPTSLDHLEFAQAAMQDAVRGLIDHLGVILQPEEPRPTPDPSGPVSERPESEVARIVHDHAYRLEQFASYVRSVSARVDL